MCSARRAPYLSTRLLRLIVAVGLVTAAVLAAPLPGFAAGPGWSTLNADGLGAVINYPSSWSGTVDSWANGSLLVKGVPSSPLAPTAPPGLRYPPGAAYLSVGVYPAATAVSPAPTGTIQDWLPILQPAVQLPSLDLGGVPNLVVLRTYAVPSGERVTGLMLLLRQAGREYQVECQARAGDFAGWQATCEAIVDSFRLTARYFSETNQWLEHGFLAFWQASGGLPVYGYPLTGEISEGGHTVQYFERQRFEYYPELAGTPYAIQLGRLGFEDAQAKSLLNSPPFQPLPANTGSDARCEFFAQTGHRLCNGFKAYWQSHGLDFGDPGISFRESLALFGYPISEEFVDPTTGLVTQYFERAVFEYHPGNPASSRVELRLLGRDLLARSGR